MHGPERHEVLLCMKERSVLSKRLEGKSFEVRLWVADLCERFVTFSSLLILTSTLVGAGRWTFVTMYNFNLFDCFYVFIWPILSGFIFCMHLYWWRCDVCARCWDDRLKQAVFHDDTFVSAYGRTLSVLVVSYSIIHISNAAILRFYIFIYASYCMFSLIWDWDNWHHA